MRKVHFLIYGNVLTLENNSLPQELNEREDGREASAMLSKCRFIESGIKGEALHLN